MRIFNYHNNAIKDKLINIFKKNTSIIISLHIPSREDDFRFIDDIENNEDYKLYIGSSVDSKPYDNYRIIKYKNFKIGILELNIKLYGETLISNPNIYVTERYNYISFFALIKVLEYLFEVKKCEKVEVIVYGNNNRMLNLMNNSIFYYEGRLKGEILINDELNDIYFYSMLDTEYYKYKREIYGS